MLFANPNSLYYLLEANGIMERNLDNNGITHNYVSGIYKKMYFIADLQHIDNLISVIHNLNTNVYAHNKNSNNAIVDFYFIIIRPNYINKNRIREIKNTLKETLDYCRELDIKHCHIECAKEVRFWYGGSKYKYVRIANIPNTLTADYIKLPKVDNSKLLRIAGIADDSIVDGPGFRLTVFTQGCKHYCKGCQNPGTWDYNKGHFMTVSQIIDKVYKNPMLQGVTLSGGDPFEQPNACFELISKLKTMDNSVWHNNYDYIAYTGYTIEELTSKPHDFADNDIKYKHKAWIKLLSVLDYVVDGEFILSKKSMDCKFRGSTNQRFLKLIKDDNGNVIDLEELYK